MVIFLSREVILRLFCRSFSLYFQIHSHSDFIQRPLSHRSSSANSYFYTDAVAKMRSSPVWRTRSADGWRSVLVLCSKFCYFWDTAWLFFRPLELSPKIIVPFNFPACYISYTTNAVDSFLCLTVSALPSAQVSNQASISPHPATPARC